MIIFWVIVVGLSAAFGGMLLQFAWILFEKGYYIYSCEEKLCDTTIMCKSVHDRNHLEYEHKLMHREALVRLMIERNKK